VVKRNADLYLRLSDMRTEEQLDGREAKLRAKAAELDWAVHRVVIENDLTGNGKASAFKRVPVRDKRTGEVVRDPDTGAVVRRVHRPGFRSVLADLAAGRADAVLAEDLDPTMRDPRDGEDFIEGIAECNGDARSLSGSLSFTDGGTDAEVFAARILVALAYKASADAARRVAARRQELAEQGWSSGPGKRMFGYRPDPDAPKYQKTLLVVKEEAKVIQDAAEAILEHDTSLASIARDLRDRGVPTATGGPWSAVTLKAVLTKPAVAGIAVHTAKVKDEQTGKVTIVRTEYPAKWKPILERDVWERLCDKLNDPSRLSTTANAPRWLGSGIFKCWCGGDVWVTGGKAHGPGYECKQAKHMRRAAHMTDAMVETEVLDWIKRDAGGLLRPRPRPGVDVKGLRAEARKLEKRKRAQVRMHADGLIDDADLAEGARAIRKRLDAIKTKLAESDDVDPLEEFRGDANPFAVWDALPLERRRQVVRLLVRVTLLPARRTGRGFDRDSVRIEPATG
jgi:DNA invertase Pin-like site-specific DNA recombinase